MRVTFVLPPVGLSGGIRVVAIYAEHLVKHGHSVTLVSVPLVSRERSLMDRLLRRPRRLVPAPRSHLDGLGIPHHVVDANRPIRDGDVPDADVIIATWWETAEWVNEMGASKGRKVYLVQGHEIWKESTAARVRATYRMPLHKIVVSQWLAGIMRDDYGDTNLDIVPNAVDHGQFHAALRGKQVDPTVGFLYAPGYLKGTDLTLEAISRLRKLAPRLKVIALGVHSLPKGLRSEIEFHLQPAQAEIARLYARCDAWLSASRSEGFNLMAVEAMACRTPVVSTRCGWPAEAIVDGQNGYLFDVDDVDALTDSTARVLALDDAAWRLMSERALDTAKQLAWSESCAAFEQVLSRILNEQDAAALA